MNIEGLINFLAFLAWLGAIGLTALVIARSRKNPLPAGGVLIGVTVVVALVLSTVGAGLVFVEPDEVGVVISAIDDNGVRQEGLNSGLHWIVPVLERVEKYPKSRQTYTMSIAPGEGQISGNDSVEARTSDGQVVHIDASVIFRIDPAKVVQVHIDWGHNYIDGLIRAKARGIIRDAVAVYGIEEVVTTHRQDLIAAIRDEMAKTLEIEGFQLVDFVLRNVAFSTEYAAAIEQKQISEQQAQQALLIVEQSKHEAEQARQVAQGVADAAVIAAQAEADALLIRADAEAEARLIQAEAEAEALSLLGAALQANPDVLTLQYIEKLAPNIEVMLLPSGSPFLFSLDGFNTSNTVTTPAPAPALVP